MSTVTPLASSQINHDQLTIDLVEPNAMPPIIRVTWPLQPSVIDPRRFPDTAAVIARLFAEAHTTLARIKAGRRL